jgi:hypothetical protein
MAVSSSPYYIYVYKSRTQLCPLEISREYTSIICIQGPHLRSENIFVHILIAKLVMFAVDMISSNYEVPKYDTRRFQNNCYA